MNVDWLRSLCLSFPRATEHVQWGNALVFKVAGKMFAVTSLEPARTWLSFKATDESFAELTERPGIIPAPYLARAKWVALETKEALSSAELSELLRISYGLVVAKLPRKTREALSRPAPAGKSASRSSTRQPRPKKRLHPKNKRTPGN